MKNITQEYVEGIKKHDGFIVVKVPVVSEAVANWFERNKEALEYRIGKYIYDFNIHAQESDAFYRFMNNVIGKPLETLISMQYGYYVQKEVSE
ncbi:DUF1642 domain-containing protein [Listeria monocytogenes]|nr:DUF1642 domain-containing protein [Listeria monocytogenes]